MWFISQAVAVEVGVMQNINLPLLPLNPPLISFSHKSENKNEKYYPPDYSEYHVVDGLGLRLKKHLSRNIVCTIRFGEKFIVYNGSIFAHEHLSELKIIFPSCVLLLFRNRIKRGETEPCVGIITHRPMTWIRKIFWTIKSKTPFVSEVDYKVWEAEDLVFVGGTYTQQNLLQPPKNHCRLANIF